MWVTVQVVLHADDDTETVVREAFTVQRGALAPETLGLQLEEAKDLLSRVQAKGFRCEGAALHGERLAHHGFGFVVGVQHDLPR